MTHSPQKICIVGAGAIGGLIAGWIAQRIPATEAEVSVLARGETLAALRERGLRIDEASAPEAAPIVVHPRAESDPAALGVQDVVAKSMGSQNPYNMIRATIDGLKQESSPRQVAQRRGKKVADILKKPEAAEAAEA